MNLFVDIETRSECDLIRRGVYAYAEDPSTEVTVVCWAIDDEPIQTWIPAVTGEGTPGRFYGPAMPAALAVALFDGARLVAHNAGFERTVLNGPAGEAIGWPQVGAEHWDCTAARAACFGLPRSLENVAMALRLPVQKDQEGRRLMLSMAKPRNPRKAEVIEYYRQVLGKREKLTTYEENLGVELYRAGKIGKPVLWRDAPEDFERLADYCETDVEVERLVFRALPALSPFERRLWELTEQMNDRGIPVDRRLLDRVLVLIDEAARDLNERIAGLTGGAVPRVSDHGALTKWLLGMGADDVADTGVGKAAVAEMIENPDIDPLVRQVLLLRREGGGVSSRKWVSIEKRLSADGLARGALVYCGAASTGRWSSRGIQLHNLIRSGKVKNILGAIKDLTENDISAPEIEMCYGPPLIVASEMLRPAFVAAPGHWLVRGDLSQIEARVNPWLAGATWKLDAFRAYDAGTGPDLYKVAAGRMYGVPASSINSDDPRRQSGKILELACGFGGSVGAVQNMARAFKMKITDEAAKADVDTWRASNPEICGFWRGLDKAALDCMKLPMGLKVDVWTGRWDNGKWLPAYKTPLFFRRSGQVLTLRRPSGESIMYWWPRLKQVEAPWGPRWSVVYRGENTLTRQWQDFQMWPGILCENAVQSIARDIMAAMMLDLDAAGLDPRLSVHDEAVCMVPKSRFPDPMDAVKLVREIMSKPISWAPGLPLAVDASAGERYMK